MTDLALTFDATHLEDQDDLAPLLRAARSGDLAAFERLVRRHERLVLVTALRLLGEIADAQDAAQEVFLRLHRNLGKIDSGSSLAGWLYRVTVNACHDQRRRRPAVAPVEDAAGIASDAADPLGALVLSERQRALQQVLRRLPEKERAAVVLRDLEGLSTREVAEALGSSEATVRSQISKARVKIRESVERFFGRRL